MAVFESLKHTTDVAIEKSEDLLKNSEAYYKLKLFQIATSSLGMLFKFAAFAMFLFITLVFIAIALALSLGRYFQNLALGYIIVAVIFLVLAVIVYLLRNNIDNLIVKIVSRKFFEEDEESI